MRLQTDNYQKIYTYNWSTIHLVSLQEQIKSSCLDKNDRLNAYINLEGAKWFFKKQLENEFHNIFIRTHFLPPSAKISERIYCILNDIKEEKICSCNKPLEFEFWSRGYRSFCSAKCRANDKELQKKVRKSNIKKYGKEHISQLKYVKNKKLKTLIQNGFRFNHYDKEGYERYAYQVNLETSKTINRYTIKHIEKRGIAGSKGAYHLDHIVSKIDGYENNVPPFIIGSRFNLKCIPWKDNLSKGNKSHKSIELLKEEYYENLRQESFRTWTTGICYRE